MKISFPEKISTFSTAARASRREFRTKLADLQGRADDAIRKKAGSMVPETKISTNFLFSVFVLKHGESSGGPKMIN
jgi:hypothetical protein